ncbi:hypothetical protein Pmani_028872 [Petrolisthes manimaculis]|uniref:Uncharacterized protein n=1 Tax=Petrolisthes manimaculis TaxID=1843537 RepID=A0AAE1NYQ1_9EUCA|nr:hypothetical protein Pmani_028872 [Petrolisthes manimaculis]
MPNHPPNPQYSLTTDHHSYPPHNPITHSHHNTVFIATVIPTLLSHHAWPRSPPSPTPHTHPILPSPVPPLTIPLPPSPTTHISPTQSIPPSLTPNSTIPPSQILHDTINLFLSSPGQYSHHTTISSHAPSHLRHRPRISASRTRCHTCYSSGTPTGR